MIIENVLNFMLILGEILYLHHTYIILSRDKKGFFFNHRVIFDRLVIEIKYKIYGFRQLTKSSVGVS